MRSYRDLPVLEGAEPFFGHVRRIRVERLAFMERLADRVDRIARFVTPAAPGVVINHPEVIGEMLVEKPRVFEKSLITRFSLAPLAGEGLFTSRYELWKRQRKLMAPLFKHAQLRAYAGDMIACTQRGVAEWRDGQELDLLRETTRITMSIAGKTLFDADTFGEADTIGAALTTALEWTGENAPSALSIGHLIVRALLVRSGRRLGVSSLQKWGTRFEKPLIVPGEEGRKLREAIAVLDERVQRMIDTRRALREPKQDLLSRLLEARDEDDGGAMSDRQVRDEVLTLFVAGHETTSTGLAWTLYCLCQNPALYDAVEREADALGHEPTLEDLPQLALTLRAFKEALRLYPPVYVIARQATAASSLDGVALPIDTIVMMSTYALHRRRDLWPDPEKFDPARFTPEAEAARHRLAWLPFGAGARVCIGNAFAMMEAQLVLAKLMQHARFELCGAEEPAASATLRPKHGVRVRVRLRQAASAVRGNASSTSAALG